MIIIPRPCRSRQEHRKDAVPAPDPFTEVAALLRLAAVVVGLLITVNVVQTLAA
jgi:hypothetical protein